MYHVPPAPSQTVWKLPTIKAFIPVPLCISVTRYSDRYPGTSRLLLVAMFEEDYVDYLDAWEIETDDDERYAAEYKKKEDERREEDMMKRKMSDVEDEEPQQEEDEGYDELDDDGPQGTAGSAAKLNEWGMNEKDWTQHTALYQWLDAKSNPRKYIINLIEQVTNKEISLSALEDKLPPWSVTNYCWKTKGQLERLRSKAVINIVGFCPQYKILLDNLPAQVEPEHSSCATTLVLSWFARQVDIPMMSWDFRMDCRKAKAASARSGYRHCQSLTPKEKDELHGLNNLLLQIARQYFDITVVGALSFNAESSKPSLTECMLITAAKRSPIQTSSRTSTILITYLSFNSQCTSLASIAYYLCSSLSFETPAGLSVRTKSFGMTPRDTSFAPPVWSKGDVVTSCQLASQRIH